MENFQIRAFKPGEKREDSADEDRTVLRLCEGFLAVPNFALCSGPQWKSLWGQTDIPTAMATALSGADASKAHFVSVARGNHVFLIVWSKVTSTPLGVFYVTTGAPADVDFDSASGITIAAPANSTYRDKDGAAPWFASRAGDRIYFGNGVTGNDNLQWKTGALSVFGPASTPSDIYDNSRVRIPPCTTFAMAGNKSIFAAGNASNPKRVWITHPPSAGYTFNEGVYSLETSFVDVLYSECTKVTALSAFQNYITAHTDAKPVNLFDVDGTNDGWKCTQAPGAANSSAPSPAAVRDTNGLASFYVGADGEIYKDEAIRVGPHDKRPARDQDIATALGAGLWNRDMAKPVLLGKVHTAYDRKTALFWVFSELSWFSGRRALWAYNERNRSVTGPFRYPNALVSAVISDGTDGTLVAVLTAGGQLLYADLAAVGETQEFLAEPASTALGGAFAELTVAPTPTPGMGYVAMTTDRATLAEFMAGGARATMATVWDEFTAGGSDVFTKFYNDAYVARFETGYMDFGDARLRKNYLDALITWQKHSRAYVGVYGETEDGRRGGKWLGLAFTRESVLAALNLHGRRIRLRVVAVCFNSGKSLIRDLSIGWDAAGTT